MRSGHTPVGVRIALTILIALHALFLLAGFVAPYDPTAQHRDKPWSPPVQIRLVDETGALHLRPFVYDKSRRDQSPKAYPLQFLVQGSEYTLFGIVRTTVHFVGVEEPARLFIFGSDEYGRDVFSRVLHGGQLSLLAGWCATVLSLGLGLALGMAAGFYGGRLDDMVMRTGELFLALPWLYLLFGIRAILPLDVEPGHAFLLIVGVIGAIGWARPARLIRGVVLSARERRYVVASRGFGASDWYIARHHVLPHTYAILLTQAAILVPHYMLAEVTLSFFGLGVAEPVPSWGNVLASLQRYHVVTTCWWMFFPAILLVCVTALYQMLGMALHERLKGATL
jgi:peptide/nickel transport system permease protein